MFKSIIYFSMALEKDPEVVRDWVYKPPGHFTIDSSNPLSTFVVQEKDSDVVQLTVTITDEALKAEKNPDGEFSRKDTENALNEVFRQINNRIQESVDAESKH